VFQGKPGILSLVMKNKQHTGAITSKLSLCETDYSNDTNIQLSNARYSCNTQLHKPAYCCTATYGDKVRVLIL
jgi:hypothetical protein